MLSWRAILHIIYCNFDFNFNFIPPTFKQYIFLVSTYFSFGIFTQWTVSEEPQQPYILEQQLKFSFNAVSPQSAQLHLKLEVPSLVFLAIPLSQFSFCFSSGF